MINVKSEENEILNGVIYKTDIDEKIERLKLDKQNSQKIQYFAVGIITAFTIVSVLDLIKVKPLFGPFPISVGIWADYLIWKYEHIEEACTSEIRLLEEKNRKKEGRQLVKANKR